MNNQELSPSISKYFFSKTDCQNKNFKSIWEWLNEKKLEVKFYKFKSEFEAEWKFPKLTLLQRRCSHERYGSEQHILLNFEICVLQIKQIIQDIHHLNHFQDSHHFHRWILKILKFVFLIFYLFLTFH